MMRSVALSPAFATREKPFVLPRIAGVLDYVHAVASMGRAGLPPLVVGYLGQEFSLAVM